MKPYYQDSAVTIYHGDCQEILPNVGAVDLVLTDPPYPDYLSEQYAYSPDSVRLLETIRCRQFVFWTAKQEFLMDYTAIHIWDKKTGCGSEYERIFERNGQRNWKVFRRYLINSIVAANYQNDAFTGHPSQKPLRLLKDILLLDDGHLVLDPFMGSGTTLRAAKDLGRKAIGIEIEERYAEIAAKRMAQEVMSFDE